EITSPQESIDRDRKSRVLRKSPFAWGLSARHNSQRLSIGCRKVNIEIIYKQFAMKVLRPARIRSARLSTSSVEAAVSAATISIPQTTRLQHHFGCSRNR